ncbi:hypothetical protein [Miniphocaeibacter massiliensis]|uniref:hypothetical protein n=1 Tax=Miniphocaeibacter massiliensis TaxID=2041841 RepID=UPI000C1BBFFC|nr:hypothetical protein [Miniphocaeibacter massiliensis]
MNRDKLFKYLKSWIKNKDLVRVFFKYEENYYYLIPLKYSKKFLLGIEEDDFLLDGYTIRKIKDIRTVSLRNDMCNYILRKELDLDNINTPNVDLSNWKTIFESIEKYKQNIIIEDEYNEEFWIGKILEVKENSLIFKSFDADGIWDEKNEEIKYGNITSITMNSRYGNIFSKYID